MNFKTDYEQDMQINIAEEFPINETAVKKTQRHFKSIIKLDKNFHIYIHGDRQKLAQGEDEKENIICYTSKRSVMLTVVYFAK